MLISGIDACDDKVCGYTGIIAPLEAEVKLLREKAEINKYLLVKRQMGDDLHLWAVGRVAPHKIYVNHDNIGPYIEIMLEDVTNIVQRGAKIRDPHHYGGGPVIKRLEENDIEFIFEQDKILEKVVELVGEEKLGDYLVCNLPNAS